jgi:hypothetical protein
VKLASSHSHGFLLALAVARDGDVRALAEWFRANPGVALNEVEAHALAEFLERPTRGAHRPQAISASEQGRVIAELRAFNRLSDAERRAKSKRFRNELAERHGISIRTVDTLSRKARAVPERKKPA